jgi:predicted nucleic acid-binding protein
MNCMNGGSVFVDTNILVYANDADAGGKHTRAVEVLEQLWSSDLRPTISVQVLQDLYVALLRKSGDACESARVIEELMLWNVVSNSPALLRQGIAVSRRWQISLWDALVVAAAMAAGAKTLLTEDLNHGQDYGGVIAHNPLTEHGNS